MKNSSLATLLKLRVMVAYLGERAQYNWWPTAFYEPSSRLFLEPAFGKTSRLAQYHGVLEAARRLHDELLSVGSYHLFRLPEETEQDLHNLMLSQVGEELTSNFAFSKEAALDAVERLAVPQANFREGPAAVGRVEDIFSNDVLGSVAFSYLAAFKQDIKSYPYLVG